MSEFDDEFPDEHHHYITFEDQQGRGGVYVTDDEGRHYWLQLAMTDEGLVLDLYDRYGDECLATWARTYDEVAEMVAAEDVVGTQTLYFVDEIGASFLFLNEEDARQAIEEERGRGLHVTALGRVSVPSQDYESYAEAVRYDASVSHLHPVFQRADREGYPTEWEFLCEKVCITDGSEKNCQEVPA